MTTEPRLAQYLERMDKALTQIGASDRAEILMEIKSHVTEAQDRDASKDIDTILQALGEPETVANRFLIERGLKPGRPPRAPMVKWLTIGFLGTFGILMISSLVILFHFSPLLKVDEQSGRVILLGGLIDINEKEGSLKIGQTFIQDDKNTRVFKGKIESPNGKYKDLSIGFNNGNVEINPSLGTEVRWDCKVANSKEETYVHEGKTDIALHFEQTSGVKCMIEVPNTLKTSLKGLNGKIVLVHPRAPMEVELENGKIGIVKDPSKTYAFDAQVETGALGNLKSDQDKSGQPAVAIKIRLKRGKVSAEDTES